MFEIRKTEAGITYNIRHNVLRPHKTIEDCKYDTDYKEGLFRFLYYYV